MSDLTMDSRIRMEASHVKGRHYPRYVVDLGKIEGKRKRKSFKAYEEAEEFLATYDEHNLAIGEKAANLCTDDLLAAVQAKEILAGRASLQEAARFYIEAQDADLGPTVSAAIDRFIANAHERNLRPTTIEDLKRRLGCFRDAFGSVRLGEIDRGDVDRWVSGLKTRKGNPLAVRSRKHFRTVCGSIFNYAIDLGEIEHNPFAKKSRSTRKVDGVRNEVMPEILSVEDVEAVMRAAESYECPTRTEGVTSMAPALAIGFFAGVRTTELTQLDWKWIDLKKRRIKIPSEIAKRRSVRFIDMQDNLYKWLEPFDRESGPVTPQAKAWRYHFDGVRAAANIDNWPHNCMRHSFASYHLVMCGDPRRTEMQLGHKSENLLYEHYRDLVTEEDAESYWGIEPKVS
jgi:integrase